MLFIVVVYHFIAIYHDTFDHAMIFYYLQDIVEILILIF